ncbi:hypothetical protein [Ectobacillus ponti]|uniref:Uncharacterized protein n=1 Tax=Ectobacillus ponti TaxID=2961894 RepID=A0AA42BQA1_9BACI|nr:hypothetical protein [Ectobacillus ponti]MCP8969657.1 hypothetical protein [Ectobacillus ponti]
MVPLKQTKAGRNNSHFEEKGSGTKKSENGTIFLKSETISSKNETIPVGGLFGSWHSCFKKKEMAKKHSSASVSIHRSVSGIWNFRKKLHASFIFEKHDLCCILSKQ